jgi:hypothetical protein
MYTGWKVMGSTKEPYSISRSGFTQNDAELLQSSLPFLVEMEQLKYGNRISRAKVLTFCENVVHFLRQKWMYRVPELGPQYGNPPVSLIAQLPSVGTDMLVLDEFNLTRSGISLVPYAAYHLKSLMANAYLDALDHIPQMNENNLSNIVGIVSFMKHLIIDHRIEMPKSWTDSWLKYRYVYSTTKSDVEDAIRFVHRHVDTGFLEKGFSCYGVSHDTVLDTVVECRCRFDAKQKELTYLNKIWSGLYMYGLSPSFYVIWDMIPYSFIVDWFIPVGDILNSYDKKSMYERTYDFSNLWYSLKYERTVADGSSISAYTRWGASSPPEYNGFYTLENMGDPSKRTIGFRILDAMSLAFRF